VENYESGTIYATLLKNYDVLVLSAPNDNFSSSEIQSIVSFVNDGGSLCFLGDAGLNGNCNLLLQNFGIKLENSSILGPAATGKDPGCLAVSNFINHVSLGLQPQFFMNYGGSFSITSPAIVLGSANNLFWRDFDWNKVHDTNEPSGPFVVFTAAIYGMGKVFCISDNALHDDYLKWGSNDKVFISAMKWLTLKPTIPNLFSPLNAESGVFTNTKLEWASVESTNYYRIQVSKTQDFNMILIDSLINNTSCVINKLDAKNQYFWRVNATNNHGESSWSAVWNFTTKAFSCIANTGNSASITLPVSAIDQNIQMGDEIGVFTPQGLCVGSGIWENKDLVITVWGDNGLTPAIDGIKNGEHFDIKIWKKATGAEQNTDCLRFSSGNGEYISNGISIVSSLNSPVTPTIRQNGDLLHSDAIFGNQWYNKDGVIVGATTQDFNPKSSGDYYVVVSANGCASNPANSIKFIATQINQIVSTTTIKVYPNPSANELNIESMGNTNKIEFEILNSISQVVYKGILIEKTIIQTASFAPGIYIIRLKSGDTFEFTKVL
jgi:hypothetical protein